VALERVWLHVRRGQVSDAAIACEGLELLAEKYDPSADFSWLDLHRYAALARAYLASAQERFDDAIAALQSLMEDAERANNHYFALRVAAHLSVVQFAAGQTAAAKSRFRQVLDVSADAGIRQTILDEGQTIGPLLMAVQDEGDLAPLPTELRSYLSEIIAAWKSRYQPGADPGQRQSQGNPLSPREGAVLNLVAQGLSNKEIARSLAITPETVKSHIKHIFEKLQVEKRVQAIARAQSLGLVTM
jgi:LuxR family maltose regulon positive regulatory protein